MEELLAGLIGVAVGAVSSGGVQAVLKWRDRRLARRVAARLILGDLFVAEHTVRSIIENGAWPAHDISFDRALAVWEAQREAFAAAVNASDWTDVAIGYRDIADLALIAQPPGTAVPAQNIPTLEAVAIRLDKAGKVASNHIAPKRERKRMLKKLTSERGSVSRQP